MRIVCPVIEDFLDTLETEENGTGSIYRKHVHLSRFRQPVDGNSRDAVKFLINMQLSAIIETEDGGQYLLQFGEDCGMDYKDSGGAYEGTKVYEKRKKQVVKCCERLGLVLRPGVVDF